MSSDHLPARLSQVSAPELKHRGLPPVVSFLLTCVGILTTAVVLGAIIGVALRSSAEADANRWHKSLDPTLRALTHIPLVRDVKVHPGLLDPIANYPLAVDLTISLQHPCSTAALRTTTQYVQVVINQQQEIDLTGTIFCKELKAHLDRVPEAT